MKQSQPIKLLHDLEAHYEHMLAGVRALIAAAGGQSAAPQSLNGKSSGDSSSTPFAEMKKPDAAAEILKKKGTMTAANLFKAMKRKKHPVASANAVSNMLSTNRRFEKKGGGLWALAEQRHES